MVEKYLKEIIPRTSDRTLIKADEVWFKIAGDREYLFAPIDDKIRYFLAYDMADTKFQHNADRLLKLTKNTIDKSSKHFTADELYAYAKSSKKTFGKTLNITHTYTSKVI